MNTGKLTQNFIKKELKHLSNNYKPMPIVISRGKGVHLWDVEGNKYLDMLAGYSATKDAIALDEGFPESDDVHFERRGDGRSERSTTSRHQGSSSFCGEEEVHPVGELTLPAKCLPFRTYILQ